MESTIEILTEKVLNSIDGYGYTVPERAHMLRRISEKLGIEAWELIVKEYESSDLETM